MKKQLLSFASLITFISFGQTTIYNQDFNTGISDFVLTGSNANTWIVNSEYVGFPGFIDDTPTQPAGITAGPNSNYLHIYNDQVCTGLGACNAIYDAASASTAFATSPSIVTTGFTSVSCSFWYLCNGESVNTDYGKVEYSTDGGGTWTQAGSNYALVSTWTNATVNVPALSNVASLKFRFTWINNASAGSDPAFSIDDFKVTGTPSATVTIAGNSISTLGVCTNATAATNINFTTTGIVNAGNVYTAELSNASGSFASPTSIGTLTSAASGAQVIAATLPTGLAVGTGYLVRVKSSNPVSTSPAFASSVSVFALPTVGITTSPANATICLGASANLTGTGATVFNWSPAATLSASAGAQVVATPTQTTTYNVIGFDANQCSASSQVTITVNSCAGIEEIENTFIVFPNPSSDIISVSSTEQISLLSIIDNSGKVIANVSGNEMNISNLADGTYILKIKTSTGEYFKSVIKN